MALINIAVATNSLGKSAAGHTILRKLEVAKSHGFDGCEVAFECLDAHAAMIVSLDSRADRLREVAREVDRKASSLSLSLIALNPFGAYDGLKDPREVDARLEDAELWCQLCQIMHIPIFQICSALYPLDETRTTSDPTKIATNMRKLGLLAQRYKLRVAYEAPSWGIHKNTWQHIQEILDLVNLPNVGHCLDTFHIASQEAGDPFNAAMPVRPDGLERLHRSLDELKQTVRPENIVYFQLSDAIVADPEQKGYARSDLNQPAFMTQSRNCRIYPCEPQYGGTLPVVDVARAVFEKGYTGWVSMEVFHTDMWDSRASVSDDWAKRGMASWRKIVAQCELGHSIARGKL